jgi:predicted transcriptional regulator
VIGMAETLQDDQELESNEIDKPDQISSNKISLTDLIATLKAVKIEEKELLTQRKELEATEKDLRTQATAEIENKKKTIEGLKAQITFQQNKCSELEQALGIQF